MPRKKIYDYESPDIVVRFEPKRCIHAEESTQRRTAPAWSGAAPQIPLRT